MFLSLTRIFIFHKVVVTTVVWVIVTVVTVGTPTPPPFHLPSPILIRELIEAASKCAFCVRMTSWFYRIVLAYLDILSVMSLLCPFLMTDFSFFGLVFSVSLAFPLFALPFLPFLSFSLPGMRFFWLEVPPTIVFQFVCLGSRASIFWPPLDYFRIS